MLWVRSTIVYVLTFEVLNAEDDNNNGKFKQIDGQRQGGATASSSPPLDNNLDFAQEQTNHLSAVIPRLKLALPHST